MKIKNTKSLGKSTRKTVTKPKGLSENQIQARYFGWADVMANRMPVLKLLFHIPNGAHKSVTSRAIFKLIGLKAGVPDVFLPVASSGFHGLWIEFKSEKGRVSDVQEAWHDALEEQGYKVIVSREWERAADETLKYLGRKPQFYRD